MKRILFVLGLVISSVVFFSSCQKEGSCYECTHPTITNSSSFCVNDTLNYLQAQEIKDDLVASGYDCSSK